MNRAMSIIGIISLFTIDRWSFMVILTMICFCWILIVENDRKEIEDVLD